MVKVVPSSRSGAINTIKPSLDRMNICHAAKTAITVISIVLGSIRKGIYLVTKYASELKVWTCDFSSAPPSLEQDNSSIIVELLKESNP